MKYICALARSLFVFGLVVASAAMAHDVPPAPPQKVDDAIVHRPTAVPDRIILTWNADPATSIAVTWRTDTTVAAGVAEITPADDGPLLVLQGERRTAATTPFKSNLNEAHYHTVTFSGLRPKTRYAYRVGDGVNWSEWSQFQTASDQPEPFSFVYFGDAQNDLKSHWSRVIREAYSDAPKAALMLHAGDLVNRSQHDAEWGDWFYAGSHIHRMIPCLATPGNHEYQKNSGGMSALAAHWRPIFAFPEDGPAGLAETVYSIDYQGVRFISLNSNEKVEEQAAWLDQRLADRPQRWTVVTFHHPIYSSAKGRDNTRVRQAWQSLFDKHRVDIVLQGHDHTYSRSGLMEFENVPTGMASQSPTAGTVYAVSVSGPKMYPLDRRPFMKRAAENTQLYQIISVNSDVLSYEARTAAGALYDAFTLRKRAGQVNELIDGVPATTERRFLGP